MLYNLDKDSAFIPISSGGGINFYLGNNDDSRETIDIRPGRFWSELTERPALEGGAATAGEQSAFFYHEALAWISAHPGRFIQNTVYKTAGFFAAHEIRRNQDIYEARRGSKLLRVLLWNAGPFGFPFGLLAPPALLGLWLALRGRLNPRKKHGLRFCAAAAVLFSLAVILFFPSARYRIILIPLFAMLAVGGSAAMLRAGPHPRAWAESAAVLLAALLLVNGGWVQSRPDPADQAFLRASALAEAGRPEEALTELRSATVDDPQFGEAWTMMSAIYGRMGRRREAMGAAYAAVAIDSTDAQAWINLGAALTGAGDPAGAEKYLRRAIRLRPHDADAWNNLGMNLIQQNRREEALRAFSRALQIDPAHAEASRNYRRYGN
jgi:tetratricopeptide (TPR) repeat protein